MNEYMIFYIAAAANGARPPLYVGTRKGTSATSVADQERGGKYPPVVVMPVDRYVLNRAVAMDACARWEIIAALGVVDADSARRGWCLCVEVGEALPKAPPMCEANLSSAVQHTDDEGFVRTHFETKLPSADAAWRAVLSMVAPECLRGTDE